MQQNCGVKTVLQKWCKGATQLPRSSRTNLNRAGQGVAPFPQPLGIPLCDQHAWSGRLLTWSQRKMYSTCVSFESRNHAMNKHLIEPLGVSMHNWRGLHTGEASVVGFSIFALSCFIPYPFAVANGSRVLEKRWHGHKASLLPAAKALRTSLTSLVWEPVMLRFKESSSKFALIMFRLLRLIDKTVGTYWSEMLQLVIS